MIQFNMLPDVKVDYIRTQRTKRIVMLGSFVAAGVGAFLLIMMFSYQATQKRHLSNLNKDISSIKSELEGNRDLTRMLSVQNQLKTLPALYDGRPAVERLLTYVEQTTPGDVGIGKVMVDFSASTLELTGTADSIKTVNAHVDTLKFTNFKVANLEGDPVGAFKDVKLVNFGKSILDGKEQASFVISMSFDPQLFDQTKEVSLLIPSIISTRAQQGDTTELFDGSSVPEGAQ